MKLENIENKYLKGKVGWFKIKDIEPYLSCTCFKVFKFENAKSICFVTLTSTR